jgi:uncharacterized protein (TIGR00297 family)
MTPAPTFDVALALTAACAVLALLARALTLGGAIAGYVVGACVSIGFGLPGLAVLGTFFVVGTLATRVGWKTKKARGTAEAGEGRRDWKRVLGKGGVAATCALILALAPTSQWLAIFAICGFPGAVAAALADTLGTEIGTLFDGTPRSLPTFRRVAIGTVGAVSWQGTAAAAAGALVVGAVWTATVPMEPKTGRTGAVCIALITACGLLASILESLAVGLGLRAPGFARNVGTTLAGALLAAASVVLLLAALD